jgi:nucleoside-triphosphatase THEP1
MTILAITGVPGIGKTTAVIRTARTLKDRGLTVGGVISRELRLGFLSRVTALLDIIILFVSGLEIILP